MTATITAPGPVLVGVDGSTQNASAVAWAAAEASASEGRTPLVLVHDAETAGRAAGRAILERATTVATALDPRLTPSGDLVRGGPATSLPASALVWERALDRSPGSALVVIGRRGQGANRRISLGSTARTLVHQGGPALVVVPDGWARGQVPPGAPVVVDAGAVGQARATGPPQDRAATAEQALALALARAHREHRPVLAVASWTVPAAAAGQQRAIREVWAEHAARADRALEALLGPWRRLHPEVPLTGAATDRSPVLALLGHAEGAELLVVPRGPRASAVVEYAEGPVAVV